MGKGRAPCCDKSKVKKGPWSPQEDLRLITFIQRHGHGNWRSLPNQAGLLRCGKSCRLRWINYLRPDLKRGNFTKEDEDNIINLHNTLGNKWSKIASYFPGRTDNEIKNVWNTHLKKRLNKKEKEDGNQSKDEAKELSKSSSFSFSSSSSCTSFISSSRNEDQGDDIKDTNKENDELSKDNSGPSNSSSARDFFEDSKLIDANFTQEEDIGFLFDTTYQEDYEMWLNPVQDMENFPLEIDFDFMEMLGKEDPIYSSYESQTKEFGTFQRDFGEGNEGMDWLRNLENELGLENTSEGNQI